MAVNPAANELTVPSATTSRQAPRTLPGRRLPVGTRVGWDNIDASPHFTPTSA